MIVDPVFSDMLSAIAVGVVLASMFWIAVRRPALGMIFFFFFFAFAWRLCSTLYIDLSGPIFSEELERDIGPGMSSLPIAISQGIVLVAVSLSFRRHRLKNCLSRDGLGLIGDLRVGWFKLPDLCFLIVSLFVLALWIELLVKGTIPLFVGMERYDYSRLYGGPLHHALLQWGPMLAFQLGIFLVAPSLREKSLDWRFGALFAALMLYLFLVGHRFSSFYSYTSFFIMPIGAAMLGRQAMAISRREAVPRRILRYVWLAGITLIVLIIAAIAYSYTIVRGFEGAQLLAKLSQRILIQQGEMWWMTYERVFLQGNWDYAFAAFKLLIHPFDPHRNSTMQLLMELALPGERAQFILSQGSAYTGGWPEVLFEVGGPVIGFFGVATAAILFSEFMCLLTRCIVQERFVTCFFLTPILYAISIMMVSGMVNSFIQVTFLIKMAFALVVYVTEDRWRSTLARAGVRDSGLSPAT